MQKHWSKYTALGGLYVKMSLALDKHAVWVEGSGPACGGCYLKVNWMSKAKQWTISEEP